MRLVPLLARAVVVLVAVYVVMRLMPVIRAEWAGQDGCPNIGVVPACYLVAFCYVLMGLAALIDPRRLTVLFLIGWLPVLLLAGVGSTFELLGKGTCPTSGTGVPMCYYSFGLAIMLAPLFFLAGGLRRSTKPSRHQTSGA